MFDDCKGEKLQELLIAFSTVVLRKVVADHPAGTTSITGRLCLAERLPTKDHASLLPLAIAHKASLKALIERKNEMRSRYRHFHSVLNTKENELNRKFDKIVRTQDFLDKNIAPEATVARVARQFENHWKGDPRLVDVIAQGEELSLQDALLDNNFEDLWSTVSDGRFVGDTSSSYHGLLEDLERRVAAQDTKFQRWNLYKEELQKAAKLASPAKRPDLLLTRSSSTGMQQRKEKDKVFSPRKSPRKSMWPTEIMEESISRPTKTISTIGTPSPNNRSDAQDIDSDFSDVSGVNNLPKTGLAAFSSGSAPRQESLECFPRKDSSEQAQESALTRRDSSPTPAVGQVSNQPNEEELLAEEIVSLTMNAEPTPMKSKASLIERTRKSMAFASPGPRLSTLGSSTIPPPQPDQVKAADLKISDKGSLLERTRQSISMVPAQPRSSRQSLNARRISKIYPTNQFETPRKPETISELTPPDELFSPGAGYDSVFKSRPKVGFSPTISPVPGDDSMGSGPQKITETSEDSLQWEGESSPLARMTAKA